MDNPDRVTPTFQSANLANRDEICSVFKTSFTASEGAEEGEAIASLVTSLLDQADADETLVHVAHLEGRCVGAILWSWLVYPSGARIRLLSPVAVHPDVQGQGVGQALIAYGLDQLRAQGVAGAVTYGDPAFYGKVGFAPITVDDVAAPYALSMPVGWLGQSLTDAPLSGLQEAPTPVPAFATPEMW